MPKPRNFDRDQVAAILKEALELGLPTISTLVDVFSVTPQRAKYMIRVVKEDGLLGVKGHQAIVALLTRGASQGSRRILVCESCRSAWPCEKAWPGSAPVPAPRKGSTRDPSRTRARRGVSPRN